MLPYFLISELCNHRTISAMQTLNLRSAAPCYQRRNGFHGVGNKATCHYCPLLFNIVVYLVQRKTREGKMHINTFLCLPLCFHKLDPRSLDHFTLNLSLICMHANVSKSVGCYYRIIKTLLSPVAESILSSTTCYFFEMNADANV